HRRRRRHLQRGAEAYFRALLPYPRRRRHAREGDRAGAVHRAVGGGKAWRPRLRRKSGRRPRQHVHSAASYRAAAMSRVLIVEDEEHLASGLRFNLEAEGYDVEVVDNGESALGLLTDGERRFDLVVLDVMLPGKDGFAVVAELRHAGHFVPVLMLTA